MLSIASLYFYSTWLYSYCERINRRSCLNSSKNKSYGIFLKCKNKYFPLFVECADNTVLSLQSYHALEVLRAGLWIGHEVSLQDYRVCDQISPCSIGVCDQKKYLDSLSMRKEKLEILAEHVLDDLLFHLFGVSFYSHRQQSIQTNSKSHYKQTSREQRKTWQDFNEILVIPLEKNIWHKIEKHVWNT